MLDLVITMSVFISTWSLKTANFALSPKIRSIQVFNRKTISSFSSSSSSSSLKLRAEPKDQTSSSPSSSFNSKFVQIYDVDGVPRNIHYVDICPTPNSKSNTTHPPLIIIGGTAQTISTYSQHIKQLSKFRRVLMPEMRCQGTMTELDPTHGNIDRHCIDFVSFLKAVNISTPIDFLGFSFGGRVGITVAALYPDLISRLSVTGVPLIRPTLGEEILSSWRDYLALGQYYECGESFMRNGYSEEFLLKNSAKMDTFIQFVLDSNNMDRVHQLLVQSHPRNDSELYSLEACAKRVKCKTQVIAATQDKIAGFESVRQLAQSIENASFAEMEHGHLAPFENPAVWRKLVTDFLST